MRARFILFARCNGPPDELMKIRIDKAVPVPASVDAAWAFLQDVEAVAACMPGARITERVAPDRYKGTVSLKLGPANLAFHGEIEVRELRPEARALRLTARGTEATGSSGASMELEARVEPAEGGSRLVGTSEVALSGKVVTFGGRVANAVADQLIAQFAANFAAGAAARAGPVPAPATPAAPLNAFAVAWGAFKRWLRAWR